MLFNYKKDIRNVNDQLKMSDQNFMVPLIRLTKLTPNTAVLVNKFELKISKLDAKKPDKKNAEINANERHILLSNLRI